MSIVVDEQVDPRPFLFSPDQIAQATAQGWLPAPSEANSVNGATTRNGNGQLHRRWSLAEYYQMAEWGWFEGVRVMLIDGELVFMATQKAPHYVAITLVSDALQPVFGAGFWIRQQAPLELEGVSDTEPDVAVVRGSRNDYRENHPRTALLVTEVSDTTLRYDRGHKASLYARGGIADYWIVNLVDRQVEVYRNPVADESAAFGFRYAAQVVYHIGEFISPLANPQAQIAVADLLP